MDFKINTKGKGLFLILSTITLILMMIITTILWWFISPRLHEISIVLAGLSLTALRVFYFILALGTILVLLISLNLSIDNTILSPDGYSPIPSEKTLIISFVPNDNHPMNFAIVNFK